MLLANMQIVKIVMWLLNIFYSNVYFLYFDVSLSLWETGLSSHEDQSSVKDSSQVHNWNIY